MSDNNKTEPAHKALHWVILGFGGLVRLITDASHARMLLDDSSLSHLRKYQAELDKALKIQESLKAKS